MNTPAAGHMRLIIVGATGMVGGVFVVLHLPELRFRLPGGRPTGGQQCQRQAEQAPDAMSRNSHVHVGRIILVATPDQ